MKLLFAFILAVVFAAVVAAPGTESTTTPAGNEPATTAKPGTPGECGEDNFAPDKSDEKRFYYCSAGKPIEPVRDCAAGTKFNEDSRPCGW